MTTDSSSVDGLFLLPRLDTASIWLVMITAHFLWHPLQQTAALLLFNDYSTLEVGQARTLGIGGTMEYKESRLGRL